MDRADNTLIRAFVKTHMVESVLKLLKDCELETLTVRCVHEFAQLSMSDPNPSRFKDVGPVMEFDIYTRVECREDLMDRLRSLCEFSDAELSSYVIRTTSAEAEHSSKPIELLRLGIRI